MCHFHNNINLLGEANITRIKRTQKKRDENRRRGDHEGKAKHDVQGRAPVRSGSRYYFVSLLCSPGEGGARAAARVCTGKNAIWKLGGDEVVFFATWPSSSLCARARWVGFRVYCNRVEKNPPSDCTRRDEPPQHTDATHRCAATATVCEPRGQQVGASRGRQRSHTHTHHARSLPHARTPPSTTAVDNPQLSSSSLSFAQTFDAPLQCGYKCVDEFVIRDNIHFVSFRVYRVQVWRA